MVLRAFLILLLGCASSQQAIASDCIRAPRSVTAVLLDISDPLIPPATLTFDPLVTKLINEVEGGGRLDIYVLKDGKKVGDKPSVFCKPEATVGGEEAYKSRLNSKFVAPAKRVFSEARDTYTSSDQSPIIESIYAISLKSFASHSSSESKPSWFNERPWFKVVVISDLLQNSSVLNFYKSIPRFEDALQDVKISSWIRQTKDVGVELIMLPSNQYSHLQAKQLNDFWAKYGAHNFCAVRLVAVGESIKTWKSNDCK